MTWRVSEECWSRVWIRGCRVQEVSELPSEEVEVSEQSSEGVLGEGSEWKECGVVLGTAGRGSE